MKNHEINNSTDIVKQTLFIFYIKEKIMPQQQSARSIYPEKLPVKGNVARFFK
jgi:hypothetical protein